jgi:hypothetical protein
MRVLIDECVTRYLKRDFIGHEVLTVEEAGFKGLKTGGCCRPPPATIRFSSRWIKISSISRT